MSYLQSKLDRAVAWIERDNERSDKILMGRPDWWHIGKILVGISCVGRAIQMAMHTGGMRGYVFAGFFLAGGLYLAYEGAAMLRTRRAAAASKL